MTHMDYGRESRVQRSCTTVIRHEGGGVWGLGEQRTQYKTSTATVARAGHAEYTPSARLGSWRIGTIRQANLKVVCQSKWSRKHFEFCWELTCSTSPQCWHAATCTVTHFTEALVSGTVARNMLLCEHAQCTPNHYPLPSYCFDRKQHDS